ncbi:MAG: hypothetical protein J0I99_00620 [Devosia sp.]|uniref:hypothetical protein n=1 Tax=Devosia sp. TaxID=1871048 RepID=UPI001ACF9A90|nr:hypothetical protein [Devosia sp.]MBN9314220.1 hypothetical protein [Devosia sp.]
MTYYPTQRQLVRRRAALVASAAVVIATSFAAGASVQRIEAGLTIEDRCNRTHDAVACIIVLDDMDDVDPPRISTRAEGASNG